MLYKKRWSDGLHDDFEHLDDFEFKHGCFGGDGGGSSGGGTDKKTQDAQATAQDPPRGKNSINSMDNLAETVNALAEKSLAEKAAEQQAQQAAQDFQAFVSSGYQTSAPPASSLSTAPPGISLADIPGVQAPDIMSNTSVAPSSPSAVTQASFGIGSLPDAPATPQMSMNAPTMSMNAPTMSISDVATAYGFNPDFNVGGYKVGFGSTPGTEGGIAGPTIGIGPGTLGIGTNLGQDQFGIGYSMKFAKGGIVTLK